jgi:protein tyrosine/serine phosphatase
MEIRIFILRLLLFSTANAMTPQQALAELSGANGPVRFAVVRDGLYRGGQPTAHHLELLRAAGIDTIVNLRMPDRTSRDEAADAARLGMRTVSVPFSGLFRVDLPYLMKAIDAIKGGGHVYVHCHVGRDRTSLIIALARVVLDGWAAAEAWQQNAVAFGYRRVIWHRSIADSFEAAMRSLGR